MIWCFMSMALGALVFGAGIIFEKFANAEALPRDEVPLEDELNARLYRQWENLLDYDGTEQEDIRYDE